MVLITVFDPDWAYFGIQIHPISWSITLIHVNGCLVVFGHHFLIIPRPQIKCTVGAGINSDEVSRLQMLVRWAVTFFEWWWRSRWSDVKVAWTSLGPKAAVAFILQLWFSLGFLHHVSFELTLLLSQNLFKPLFFPFIVLHFISRSSCIENPLIDSDFGV